MRNDNGTFAAGNPGGPGRPRRKIETDYLFALTDVVDLDAWILIATKARDDAIAGDPRAREWLGRYILGSAPPTLLDAAGAESVHPPEKQIAERAQKIAMAEMLANVFGATKADKDELF